MKFSAIKWSTVGARFLMVAKRKTPKSVMVFGEEIKINIVKNLGEIGNAHGMFVPKTKQILIDEETSKDRDMFWITLLHEMFHAYASRISLKDAGISDEMEELIADTFAKFLTETFDLKFRK